MSLACTDSDPETAGSFTGALMHKPRTTSTLLRTARRLPQRVASIVMFCTAGVILIAALSESALIGMFELPGRVLSGLSLADETKTSSIPRDL
jgi:hypothetical protein